MGKQGPCFHCGVTSTPLWRNGPPEKPVLCNACGSRWRTKGTLVNYTPLHARAEPDDFVEYKVPKVKLVSVKNKEVNFLKRKQIHEHFAVVGEAPQYDQNWRRSIEEDTSNRSSSGSAISYSESCAQYGGTDASSAQSIVWDTHPSRKRTCVTRTKPSSVEKLTKELYSILHDQQSSHFSGSSEEDLLFDGEAPMVSVEFGHGSILMKHPNSVAREEESEASSFTIDNKSYTVNEYSGSTSLPVHIDSRSIKIPNVAMVELKKPVGQGTRQLQNKGEKSHETIQVLRNCNSPLRSIDLKDVVTYEEFVNHFTHEEQLQLMKYLPSVDTFRLPESLKSMFDSLLFAENLSSFQKLLAEGVFDRSLSEVDADEFKTLKKLALVNLTKSNWIEHYNLLKDVKNKQKTGAKELATGSKMLHVKRPRNGQNPQELQAMMKSPKRTVTKPSYETKDVLDHEGSCFSPRSLFGFAPDKSSLMLDYLQFNDETSDQDLLLDVPSNGSFPQAELLYPTSSFSSQQASTSSSTVYSHLA
ncbi:hypothetical protein AQUCO_05300062v1 [Aquilegia coerulea]|uniref:Uncharacterized protein n=2 Tax=Aquilegia coerulea TaxID=218851 RepID=A0A2G5CI72_AQUCA|nr:hypothetical protein AQUCO_05300062v1 [Aquilegia coerulea]